MIGIDHEGRHWVIINNLGEHALDVAPGSRGTSVLGFKQLALGYFQLLHGEVQATLLDFQLFITGGQFRGTALHLLFEVGVELFQCFVTARDQAVEGAHRLEQAIRAGVVRQLQFLVVGCGRRHALANSFQLARHRLVHTKNVVGQPAA